MAARNKIAPEMLPGIYERAGKGKSLAEICAWLKSAHGVSVSATAVRKKLAKHRAERSEVTKAVVREQLAKTVTSDLDHLDRQKRRLAKLATVLFKRAMKGRTTAVTTHLYCNVVEQLRKVVDTRLHYSGADAPDDAFAELAAAERTLASGVAGLADRLRKAGVLLQPQPAGEGGP